MRAEESLMALGTLVDDRYALERSLGKGGMGEVGLQGKHARRSSLFSLSRLKIPD